MKRHPNWAIVFWLAVGVLSFVLLPWYAIQDTAWYLVLPQIFAGPESASGIVQATQHGRVWLWLGAAGLGLASVSLLIRPGKTQGHWLLAAGLIGAAGLLLCGFLIGAKGWSFALLNGTFGELTANQFGLGIGGFLTITSLVLLFAFGVARCGRFKGDLFVAGSVVGCGFLLLL